jgi:hypothetical protein
MNAFDERYRQLSDERRALLDRWLAAEPTDEGQAQVPYAAPTTDTERILVEVWQDALDVARVGIDDDYFGLGGDSIRAIVVVARAEAAGLAFSTQDLFDARTVRQLAPLAEPVIAPSVIPRPRRSPESLTPLQEGILFHTATADRPVYLVQITCELHGELDVPAFHRAWQAVVDRHAPLRAVFRWTGGDVPSRSVAATATVPLADLDWHDVPDCAARLAEWLATDAAAGFDLTAAPLLRVTLIRAPGTYRFVLTHHHLLLDGWSQQLVIADVLRAYARLRAGRPPDVPDRPASIDEPDPPSEAQQREFWRGYLAGRRAPTRLPAPSVPASGPATAADVLPQPDSGRLTAFCRHHGVTLNTVLQGAWAAVLAHVTGTDDVVFGATTSGRAGGRGGAADAIGMFINTLPVRVRRHPDDALLASLHDLQRRQASTIRYERTPLTAIADRSPGQALFDTILVVENFPDLISAAATAAGLRVGAAETFVDEGYPFVVEVAPGEELSLRARYDTARVDTEQATHLLAAFRTVLTAVPDDPHARLDTLAAGLASLDQRRRIASDVALRASAGERLRASQRQPVTWEDT